MTDQQQRKGRPPLGPTGDAVRANIRSIRDSQGISGPELSARMTELGRPIPPLGIHRIENGQRRVDADDLAALAIALNVSPASLLMPDLSAVKQDSGIHVTGLTKVIKAKYVWAWLIAARPIVDDSAGTFLTKALPNWEIQRRYRALHEATRNFRPFNESGEFNGFTGDFMIDSGLLDDNEGSTDGND